VVASAGDRVVVRFRKGPGAPADWRADDAATLSDVTGILESADPDIRVRRGGESLRIPAELVVAVKVLSDKPVRNSEIRSLEVAAARGWPGLESEMIDGWLARAGGGFTRRANSAVPLEMGARLDSQTTERLRQWYTARDLPLLIAAVSRLIPGSHVPEADYTCPVDVLTAPIGTTATSTAGHPVTISDQPSDEWIAVYADRRTITDVSIARDVVTASDGGHLRFAEVRDPAGAIVAIGRGGATTGLKDEVWLGVSALLTVPEHRGHGYGRSIMAAIEGWGATAGAVATYLQVETTNQQAREWYRRLGFGLHHSYGYIDSR
jgi:N-acetylglutamate synthase